MTELAKDDILFNSYEEHQVKLLEEQLNSKQLLLEAVFQSSPLAYFVVGNRDDSIVHFNSQFCKMWCIEHLSYRMKKCELKNSDIIQSCLSLIADKQAFIETCKALQDENNRITIEDEILFTDGRVIRIFSDQVRDELDNYIGRFYLFEDISQSKKNELNIKHYQEQIEVIIDRNIEKLCNANDKLIKEISEKQDALNKLEKYKLLSQNTQDIILFVGMDGKILEANEAAVRNYGYEYIELCSMKIQDLRYDGRKLLDKTKLKLANKHGYTFESVHRRKDGSLFPVEVSSQGTTVNGQRVLLSVIRDISERKRMEEQLENIAKHDYLTKLPNRFYLENYLTNIHTNMRETENILIIMDLDNFKIINDSYGHFIGDKVLIAVADCIKKNLRDKDFIARIGEDEFAIFLSNTNLKGAQIVANKILRALENEVYYNVENNIRINVTATIGISIIDNSIDANHFFAYADASLFAAKEKGRNRVVNLENCLSKNLVLSNNRILTMIQNALVRDRFLIYLQPIHKTGHGVLHYEVLVRMLDDDNKILPPSSFIPLAERYSLMPLIDRWVITYTTKLLSQNNDLNVFINLSGISLSDDSLLQWIDSTIRDSNINPTRIGFEITETTAIRDLEKAKIWIYKLKALGCRFALDDFGSGFSSFSYLNILPVDYLKIDGTFVRDLDSDSTKLAIVQSINMVAHALGKETIAEFVETESIWKKLQELGVDYGQGYFLGTPAPLNT
jgi:diguanylate cyclase (GGDEF)-like protein/PAS domain S-box-containing protein